MIADVAVTHELPGKDEDLTTPADRPWADFCVFGAARPAPRNLRVCERIGTPPLMGV
jgi:hypothetical protein